jgi:6-phosphogluconolactonase (cycloisomerase 2 family)
VAPDGRHVYATGALSSALAASALDATRDGLAFRGALEDGAGGVLGLGGASAVTVSPDARHVYATGAGDGALAVFARDASADALAFVEAHFDGVDAVDGLAGAAAVAVAPDGRAVFVAGAEDDALAVFARAPSGRLRFLGAVRLGTPQRKAEPSAVATSADGRWVFVTGRASGDLLVFRRDPAHLLPIAVEGFSAGEGVPGLAGASGVAVTPDGRRLLATGGAAAALVVFDLAPLFADGFESGDLSAWSDSAPRPPRR